MFAVHSGVNWDRLAAWDPGLKRYTTALRATTATCIAVGLLLFAVRVFHVALAEGMLGVLVAMLATRAVNDSVLRARHITMLLTPIPVVLVSVLGALTVSSRLLADIVFVAVLFAAVYIRRYGTRFVALGMFAVIPYFFVLTLKASFAELPALIVATAVGTAIAFLVRFVLLPEHQERTLTRMQSALRARQRLIVRATLRVIVATDKHDVPAGLRRQIVSLNEVALAIDEQLSKDDVRQRLRELIFDAELATENFVATALRFRKARGVMPSVLHRSLEAFCHNAIHEARELAASDLALDGDASREHRWLRAAIEDLETATIALVAPRQPSAAFALTTQPLQDEEPKTTPGLLPTTRQAIQISLAATAAIVAGELISPIRWYWAVIAVFVVFSGTTSSGDTIAKAWERAAGTALGVGGGIALGTLIGGNVAVEAPVMILCLFLAMYLTTLSYVAMTFFMTLMVSLLYALLGEFSAALLLTRLELTLIGAACGVIAATLILQSPSRDAVRMSMKQMLDAVSDIVEQSVAQKGDGSMEQDSAWAVDRALANLRMQASPRLAATYFTRAGPKFRRQLQLLSACAYYARNLSQDPSAMANAASEGVDAELRRIAETVRGNIASLIELIDGRKSSAHIAPLEPIANFRPRDGALEPQEKGARKERLRLLQHLDGIVGKLAVAITW